MEQRQEHVAVLQQETLEALQVQASGVYIDGTYGRGGHSGLILERLGRDGRLIALDQDPDAIEDGRSRFQGEQRFSLHKNNFEALETLSTELGVLGQVDGVLLDVGVSSPQIDTPERGFSFAKDGSLDMRMDPSRGQSARDWLATVSANELADVLREYGEERYSGRIARAIVDQRTEQPLMTTLQLAEIVKKAHPRWEKHHHPATRTFQAIRIYINRELQVLESALQQCTRVLKPGGRLVVISFHSLEDRLVKRFFRGPVRSPDLPRHLPDPQPHDWNMRALGRRVASADEIAGNPRARSAVLRFGERIR